jgi:hypothetical protein
VGVCVCGGGGDKQGCGVCQVGQGSWSQGRGTMSADTAGSIFTLGWHCRHALARPRRDPPAFSHTQTMPDTQPPSIPPSPPPPHRK